MPILIEKSRGVRSCRVVTNTQPVVQDIIKSLKGLTFKCEFKIVDIVTNDAEVDEPSRTQDKRSPTIQDREPLKTQYREIAKSDYSQGAKTDYSESAKSDYSQGAKTDYGQSAQTEHNQSAKTQRTEAPKNQCVEPPKTQYDGHHKPDYVEQARIQYSEPPKPEETELPKSQDNESLKPQNKELPRSQNGESSKAEAPKTEAPKTECLDKHLPQQGVLPLKDIINTTCIAVDDRQNIPVAYIAYSKEKLVLVADRLKELTNTLDSAAWPIDITTGDIVFAKSSDDNQWYRGVVEGVNDKIASILFFDWGLREEVSVSNLRRITQDNLMPCREPACAIAIRFSSKPGQPISDFLNCEINYRIMVEAYDSESRTYEVTILPN